MDSGFDWVVIRTSLPYLFREGMTFTVTLTLLAMTGGIIFGTILAMMRLANPRAEVRVAAGREGHLRSLEALSLWPANSLFVEGYLTTRGDGVADTYRMIRDAGFVVERPGGAIIPWSELGLDDVFRVEGSEKIMKPAVLAQLS